MTVGAGKYDALCTYVRVQSRAQAAIVMVINGNKGSGFSVQSEIPVPPAMLADMLREMANDIEGDIKRD